MDSQTLQQRAMWSQRSSQVGPSNWSHPTEGPYGHGRRQWLDLQFGRLSNVQWIL